MQAVTIAHVDDDPVDGVLIKRHLDTIESLEVDYWYFADPGDALAALRENEVDLVLLDHLLGASTGLEVLAGMRAAGITAPVIFLTDQSDHGVTVEIMKAGADDYLAKTAVSPRSLERAITNTMKKAELRAEIEARQADLERTNRELSRRNEEIRTFYHTLSHELKTPLTAARSFLTILVDEIDGALNGNQREYTRIALESCDQIRMCIDDLLDATRLETGKLQVCAEPGHLERVIERAVAGIRPRAEAASIEIICSSDENLPQALLDFGRVTQVVNNLLDNAIKFTPSGGSIAVHASSADDQLMVSVRDTGRGVDPEVAERIFDRLFQVERGDSSGLGGLGIGLTLCREIVRQHGGTIWLESTASQGSEFRFTLPAVPQHEVAE